jgi:predicted  nucleic acid-binding Zn-ribbon protein
MHLEKVTSGSGHAALAGWISSNDVTLFTTVLVMAIALFLQTQRIKGAKENVQLTQEKASLSGLLETTTGKLEATDSRLDQAQHTLQETEKDRNQLQLQLAAKRDELVKLQTNLNALADGQSRLESQHQTLLAAREALSKENAELLAQQVSLSEERGALESKVVTLRERLNTKSNQLTESVAALEQAEMEGDRLKHQAAEGKVAIADLKRQIEKLNHDLSEARADAATMSIQAKEKVQELESQLGARDKAIGAYRTRLDQSTETIQGLTDEKSQLERTLQENELKQRAQLLEEGRNNRELVGLTGRLERVAILFDASGSMRQATASGVDRWDQAQAMAERWLQHLNVQQCVLIVYSSGVRTFPGDGSLADLRGESGKANRELLLQQVKAVTPDGWTNTYDALRKAYQYDVDSILLFSDGAPTAVDSNVFDPATASRIYSLCRAHPDIPIHTVGLGNYFQQSTASFLMSLAQISGGTFRGQ